MSLRIFNYREGHAGVNYFEFENSDGTKMELTGFDEVTLSVKGSAVDTAAIFTIEDVDGEMTVNTTTHQVEVTLSAAQIAALSPGDYVADFFLQIGSTKWQTDMFIWRVLPRIAQEQNP